jgi:MFS family permease
VTTVVEVFRRTPLPLLADTMLWISIGVTVAWIAIMLIAGRLADRLGHKPMFVAGTGIA